LGAKKGFREQGVKMHQKLLDYLVGKSVAFKKTLKSLN
jgi:hypothetical protein